MSRPLYSAADFRRETGEGPEGEVPWRGPIDRDYGRVIHSACFRRLQGKTQVFPGHESDFFRNRLTHSLEVAQIAEGIAERLNYETPALAALPYDQRIKPKLCAVAALLHDLGHPPFGHNGEQALDDLMKARGGFEGNAQTLRIVARLEKKSRGSDGEPLGLALTYRTLAAILKYDRVIPEYREDNTKIVKGYYYTERDLVAQIKSSVCPDCAIPNGQFKTVECAIMDLADDIAYSTYDLEDSLKAGFLSPSSILASDERVLKQVAEKVGEQLERSVTPVEVVRVFSEIFEPAENESDPSEQSDGTETPVELFVDRFRLHTQLGSSSYFRTKLSSELVKNAINAVTLEYDKACPALSKVKLSDAAHLRVEVLKQYVYLATIYSSRVKLSEYRGYEVVKDIFDALSGKRGNVLMPDDVRIRYEAATSKRDLQMRIVCDFVAGMTDRYAMEFWGRLHSDGAQSMFKPL